ncbi:PREDICTED: arf-GAP with dual PH domain-containing protein 2 [Colobus angolensis palliatus]|uniref:arf-GAP with dual PH domain-containing protein 2 n=1 Tax=Colobus angolensis palliatus TaxID=336983 RepID=UPI0005F58A9A|nr:PREDICTED: arf-GAP with dual PH domain-containing protein 2 [Colobus angolensis palliatus]
MGERETGLMKCRDLRPPITCLRLTVMELHRPPTGPLAHPTPPLGTTGSRLRPPLDPDVGPAGRDPSHPHREPLTRAPRAVSAPGPGPSEPRLCSPRGTRRGSSHVLGPRHESWQPGALPVPLSSLARHPTTRVRALGVCAPRRAPSPRTQTSQLGLESRHFHVAPPQTLSPGPGLLPGSSPRSPRSGRRANQKVQAGRLVRLRWEKGRPACPSAPIPALVFSPRFPLSSSPTSPPADPDWASYKLGIFICLNCCGVHRNFPDISRVKSVRLDFWDDSIVEFMTHNGNLRVKAKFEARVPAFYYIPQANDCLVLKEQWIRAKYERREFMADGETISLPGNREGFLWKRGRDNSQFLRRRFVLLAREGLLKYYTKEGGKSPKAVISIKDLNATFQTEKIGHPHGLQITYRRDGHIRNLFVYHESGKVRRLELPPPPPARTPGLGRCSSPLPLLTGAVLSCLLRFSATICLNLSSLPSLRQRYEESRLVPFLTRNYLKQGFMEKTGPKQREPFKKRWFALDCHERRLLYYKNPLDAFEQGQVFLGNKEQGYEVYEDLPKGIRGNRWKAGLTIVTPERRYVLTCPNEKEQQEWLESLRGVLSSPLTLLNRLTASTESGRSSR